MMHNPNNANEAFGEMITEIIRAATCGPISDDDAKTLCLACGLDSAVVIPPQQPLQHPVAKPPRKYYAPITGDNFEPF
jgi:hypothetical protein